MKKLFMLILVLGLLVGCASNKYYSFDQSNVVMIEKSVKNLDLNEFVKPHLIKGDRVLVQSIEEAKVFNNASDYSDEQLRNYWFSTSENTKMDWGTRALVEDNLISKLLESGYTSVERDPDLIWRIYNEAGNKYSISYFEDSSQRKEIQDMKLLFQDDNENSEINQAAGSPATNINVNLNMSEKDNKVISTDSEMKEVLRKETKTMKRTEIETDLLAADKILTYRVLECGVIYQELDDKDKTGEEKKRLARTRLHCRLIDAKTGVIIAAGLLENEEEDILPTDQIRNMETIHYDYYDFRLPARLNKDLPIKSEDFELKKSQKVFKKSKSKLLPIFGGIGSILLLGLLL